MRENRILVIGSSEASARAVADLEAESWEVVRASALSEAILLLEGGAFPIAVADTGSLSEAPWLVMERLREKDPITAVVLLVASGTPGASFGSYRHRPAGLLLKPVDRNALSMAVDSALVFRRLLEENRDLKRQLGGVVSRADWVGCSPEAQEVRRSIAMAALSTAHVLLLGEDGSGRRLAAELLHRRGRHARSAFMAVDLNNLPRGELRPLLGSLSRRAHGERPGTLYLAELTALEPEDRVALREKLLAGPPFRVVASARPSIGEDLETDRIDRETLSSIAKITIRIPALRERPGDVPSLIDHFLKRFCHRFEVEPLGFPTSAIEGYSSHDWPGNVSELAMMVERAVSIASAAKFEGRTLPERFCSPPSPTVPDLRRGSLRELIADIEKRIILQALERVDGSQKRAAKELRLNPTTLHEKMKRYKILPPRSTR